jgi:4-amino-4-deoxy-L-arabinose transferase-like glycosyltransferase
MAKQPATLPAVGRPSGWLWLILAYGAAIRAFNLTEPWGRHLLGIDGAWHSIIGRNLLRHGFFATRGAPVLNPGQSIPGEWTYYLHHPPLLDWIVALSFRIFGIHEWSARLVPLLFSLGTIVLTYRLACRLFPASSMAVAAAFFMATIPMSAIYGMHVDYHGAIVLAFALAAISAYERLTATGERRYGLFLIAMVTLCALTDWPGFYLPPLVLAHAWLSRPSAPAGDGSRQAKRWAIALLLWSLLLLAAIFLYFQMVHGDLEFMLRKFVQRTYRLKDDTRRAFDLADWIRAIARYQRALNTLPMLIGAAIWILAYVRRRIRGQTALADGFVWILLGFGAMHIVLPFQMAYVHDCLGIYLTPAFAVCAGVTVHALWQAAERMAAGGGARLIRWVAVAGLALLWTGWAASITVDYPRARQRESDVGHFASPKVLGTLIRDHTAPDQAAIVFDEDDCAPALWFYADRPLTPFVYTATDLDELMHAPELWGPECFPIRARTQPAIAVLPEQTAIDQPHVAALLASYPHTVKQGMRIYDLRPID